VIQVSASKFKEQCFALLDSLGPEGIVITKDGKPVARVIPANADCAELIGSMKRQIRIKGDVLSTRIHWNAASGFPFRPSLPRRTCLT
jgi:antitoxin (DNA-binding transcriptional repressor) of toxin-antitoxin stability system